MMCHVGCYCPRDTPLFDDAQGKCITSDKCPAANECEASIKADYLDSGNVPAKCSDTSGGAVCATKCASATCVPRKNFPGADKLEAICARFTEDSCGKDQLARNCEWAPAVPEGSRPAKKAVIFFGWAFFLVSLGGQAPPVLGPHGAHARGAKRNRSDCRSRIILPLWGGAAVLPLAAPPRTTGTRPGRSRTRYAARAV